MFEGRLVGREVRCAAQLVNWMWPTMYSQGDETATLYSWVARLGTGLMRTYVTLALELSFYARDEFPYVYWY